MKPFNIEWMMKGDIIIRDWNADDKIRLEEYFSWNDTLVLGSLTCRSMFDTLKVESKLFKGYILKLRSQSSRKQSLVET